MAIAIGTPLVLLLAWALLGPTPVEPLAWLPKRSPGFTGPFAKSGDFSQLTLFPIEAGGVCQVV